MTVPAIRRDLGSSMAAVQWVLDGYTLPLAGLLLTAGVLGDRFGLRRMLLAGIAVFTAASEHLAGGQHQALPVPHHVLPQGRTALMGQVQLSPAAARRVRRAGGRRRERLPVAAGAGITPEHVAFAGDSVGGWLAVTAHCARELGRPPSFNMRTAPVVHAPTLAYPYGRDREFRRLTMRQPLAPLDDDFWPTGTFLAMLTRQSRRRLLSLGMIRSFPANYQLARQGEPAGSVWLLLDALVKVTARVENGRRSLLAIRVSGDIVGEMSVISGASRSADVTTCGRVVVCQLKGAVFVEFLRANSAASLALSRLAFARLRWANQRRLDFAGYETSTCLARALLALAAQHGCRDREGVNIGVPVTQGELGSLVGAKEGTVQKALRQLATLRLVRPGHRTVTISDVAGLTAFADLPARSSTEIEGIV